MTFQADSIDALITKIDDQYKADAKKAYPLKAYDIVGMNPGGQEFTLGRANERHSVESLSDSLGVTSYTARLNGQRVVQVQNERAAQESLGKYLSGRSVKKGAEIYANFGTEQNPHPIRMGVKGSGSLEPTLLATVEQRKQVPLCYSHRNPIKKAAARKKNPTTKPKKSTASKSKGGRGCSDMTVHGGNFDDYMI